MISKIKYYGLLVLLVSAFLPAVSQVGIIPQPVYIKLGKGTFTIDENTKLVYEKNNQELTALGSYLSAYIQRISPYLLQGDQQAESTIELKLSEIEKIGEEGYTLLVSPTGVQINANTPKGVFYGIQSLIQILPAIRTNEPLRVPYMEIEDYPTFSWRGMMLDVSRHFYSVEAIKEFIDLLALYKMNVFHWHLTDNEGWRLEIKKYPKLTLVGAWRKEIPGSIIYKNDSTYQTPLTGEPYVYGGYYTQEQAKEVVAYAKKRNITVVPEIEMPGHSGAALSAYPQFSCFAYEQETPNSTLWNGVVDPLKVNQNYCAGNDSAFMFLEDILTEVMEIFPSKYIHIGGDEVDKYFWEACAKCQQRIKDEGLKDEEALQSYFIHRMEKFLLKKNRQLVGWDEILEGGLAPSATVMSWRGEKGGIAAAQTRQSVIMSPSDPLYFNRSQSDAKSEPFGPNFTVNSLEKVYNYDPIPKGLQLSKRKYILGSQFAIWTEFISSVEHLEYMLLPRMPALAEGLWTPIANKDYRYFIDKLNGWHFVSWEQRGIRFHRKYYTSRSHEENR